MSLELNNFFVTTSLVLGCNKLKKFNVTEAADPEMIDIRPDQNY